MMDSRSVPKTIILKSPDSDKVREIIITSVLLPKYKNAENSSRISTHNLFSYTGRKSDCLLMENRTCKRRLDNLTLEEKIQRKKLKNREAAQTSRDKKKALMEKLVASLKQLQTEKDTLHDEVQSLKEERDSLERENARLSEEVWRLSVASGPSGPAESCPLPQGERPRSALHRPLLTWILLALTGTGWTQTPSHLPLKNLNNSQARLLLKQRTLNFRVQKHRKKQWWGRKQKAWNPVGLVLKKSVQIIHPRKHQ